MKTLNALTQSILDLSKSEQAQLCQVLKDNATIFYKIIPEIPLVSYIATGKLDGLTQEVLDMYNEHQSAK